MDLSLEDPIVQFTVYHKALQDKEQSLQNFFERIMNIPGYSMNTTIPCNTRNMS